jgi:sialidase-1
MRKIIEPPADARRNEVAIAQNLGGLGGITANNPLAIVDQKSGAVHFLYCIEYARCFYQRSDDEGETWSAAIEITTAFEEFKKRFPWKVLATGPGHGIQLANGRLLVPVWLSTGTGGHAHRPSVNATIYSDDHGKTWQAGAIVAGEFNPDNPSETAVIELSDGRVMLNFRHESLGRGRGVVFSPDGISDWSPVQFDASLPEPVCMASLVRLSRKPESDRNRILFSNPNNPIDRRRRNVTVRLSYDEGETWPVGKSIEPAMSGYSDLAVAPDGTIHCLYERGTVTGNQYNIGALCVASFNLEWLTDGLDRLGGR